MQNSAWSQRLASHPPRYSSSNPSPKHGNALIGPPINRGRKGGKQPSLYRAVCQSSPARILFHSLMKTVFICHCIFFLPMRGRMKRGLFFPSPPPPPRPPPQTHPDIVTMRPFAFYNSSQGTVNEPSYISRLGSGNGRQIGRHNDPSRTIRGLDC